MASVPKPLVLLLGFGEARSALGERLLGFEFGVACAETLDEALAVLRQRREPVGAVLLPDKPPFEDVRGALEELRSAAPLIEFVILGETRDPPLCAALKEAGVRLCVRHRDDESALRFAVNAALFDRTRSEVRATQRVVTPLVARVVTAAGEKVARVYSLSECGCYLETQRPTGVGGHIRLDLPLPTGRLALPARVVVTNVPGNLQRRNLPLGMGVRFESLDDEQSERLRSYIDDCAASLVP